MIMKDQLERLQAQVAAMQQQHDRLVVQIQRLEAKLRQLEGQVQAVPYLAVINSPKTAWAPHQPELVGLDSVAVSVLHSLTP